MAVSNPITSFGVHQAIIQDLNTYEMFQILILDSVEPDFTQEMIDLRGGGSAFPWASAPGEATGEIAMTIKQYDAGVLKYFSPWITGSTTETAAGEAAGNVGSITNVVGTSVVDAATGIASVAADPAGTLRLGDYVVEAISATTVDHFVNTNIDGHTYQDDALKISASAITIPDTGGTIVDSGIQYTGGSGSVAMTIGDKAIFSARPISSYLLQHQIGKTASAPLEFSMTIVGEKIGDKIRKVTYPRCIAGGGAGLKFPYKEWAMFETTIKLLQDTVVGYVGEETIINR
ncbi:hypothetical protein KAU11_04090 [Candidatus Babeliales bacterium]|nr:hypothetical protein [Candidatus Babeliales bacterium]